MAANGTTDGSASHHPYSEHHSLSNADLSRFSRQLILDEIGVAGQQRLKNASVLIVGAGGLGCPVAIYLAAAGIGRLGIVDYDTIEINNLHRQILHKEKDVGTSKARSVESAVKAVNSDVHVVLHEMLFEGPQTLDIVKEYDIVADCSDNAATRYLLNDACVLMSKPLVSGSALRFDGQLTVYHEGGNSPCYRCIYPVAPPADTVTNCSDGGVLGPVVGVIGSLQAMETIKIIVGLGSSYSGFLFLFDGLRGETRKIKLRPRNPSCAVCGDTPSITQLQDYVQFCGSGACDKVTSIDKLPPEHRVTADEFNDKYMRKNTTVLFDTRPAPEFEMAHLPTAVNFPLADMGRASREDIVRRMHGKEGDGDLANLENSKDDSKQPPMIFVVCHRGNDSQLGVLALKEKLQKGADFCDIHDIVGGLAAWTANVDKEFPVY